MKEVKRVLPIVAVYDNLIGYKNINITQNKAVAVRGFSNSIKLTSYVLNLWYL